MSVSQALLLPLSSLPRQLEPSTAPSHRRGPVLRCPDSATSRLVRANAGKGFGQLVEKSPPPLGTNNGSIIKTQKNGGDRDDDEEIPPVVFERMTRRILFYVGAPMATSVGLLLVLDKLKTQQVLEVPVWVPFLTILIGFGSSAIGIAYGTLSASWDPDKEGSLLGWEEARKNWPKLWEEDEKPNSSR